MPVRGADGSWIVDRAARCGGRSVERTAGRKGEACPRPLPSSRGQGRKPAPADVQRVVEALKSGAYDFSRTREGEEGEDVNKASGWGVGWRKKSGRCSKRGGSASAAGEPLDPTPARARP